MRGQGGANRARSEKYPSKYAYTALKQILFALACLYRWSFPLYPQLQRPIGVTRSRRNMQQRQIQGPSSPSRPGEATQLSRVSVLFVDILLFFDRTTKGKQVSPETCGVLTLWPKEAKRQQHGPLTRSAARVRRA